MPKFFAAFFGLFVKLRLGCHTKAITFFFQMLMSAMMVAMTVTRMPTVKTPQATLHAIAKTDTAEMDATVQVKIS